MLKPIAILATAFISFSSIASERRNPMGEVANFQHDNSGERTSRLVSKGTTVTTVASEVTTDAGLSYGVKIDYDVTMKITGSFKDSFEMVFPEEFFTPAFIEKLRQTGSYESADYKIKYEGQADARTTNGTNYPASDILLIYDIKVEDSPGLYNLLSLGAGFDPTDAANKEMPMTDLKIRAHVFQGIPALSAVKLDLAGKIRGVPSKLGFDYVP